VAPAADVDRVFVDAIAGTILTLKATSVGTPILTPQVVLKDRNAAVIGTAGETGSKVASLTTGPLPSTGRYAIEVSGLDGTTGKYKFIFRETLPKSQTNIPIPANPPTAVGPGQALFAFEAKPGFLLKGSITGKNGLLPIVASLDGPSGSILGDPNVSSKILIVNGGRTIQFKGVPLTELGAYALSIGASGGTTGTITGSLTITAPKSVKIFVEK
jgi:hypothetical protein